MDNFWTIFWSIIATLAGGLATWLTSFIVNWLNGKIKDQKLKTFLTKLTEIIMSCVNALTQTTVEELKKAGKFDDEAKKNVKEKCIELVKGQLSVDMIKFITENFGDVKEYISTQIESFIFKNK